MGIDVDGGLEMKDIAVRVDKIEFKIKGHDSWIENSEEVFRENKGMITENRQSINDINLKYGMCSAETKTEIKSMKKLLYWILGILSASVILGNLDKLLGG